MLRTFDAHAARDVCKPVRIAGGDPRPDTVRWRGGGATFPDALSKPKSEARASLGADGMAPDRLLFGEKIICL